MLTLVAVRDDRRRREQVAEAGRRTDRTVLGDRLADGEGEVTRVGLAPAVFGKVRRGIPGTGEDVPPLGDGEVGVPVVLEPLLHLGADVLDAG